MQTGFKWSPAVLAAMLAGHMNMYARLDQRLSRRHPFSGASFFAARREGRRRAHRNRRKTARD